MNAWVQVTGFGFAQYWRDNWNKFDFVVVATSIGGLIFEVMSGAGWIWMSPLAR